MVGATSWYEIAVIGDEDAWARLLGAQEARTAERAVRGPDLPLGPKSLGDRLHAGLDARTHQLAFAPRELTRAVLAALAAAIHPGLRLERVREVTGCHFDFAVEAFAEPAAKAISAVLASPPPEVEVHGRDNEDVRQPEAGDTGVVELYAPVQCQAFRTWGTVTGPLPGLVELHRRLHLLPFVYEEKIELAARRIDPADLR
jgi:hypothetical protein